MALRWKKQPPETGLRSVAVNPAKRSSDLHDGTKTYATVSALDYHVLSSRGSGWYWVAFEGVPYRNTCNEKPQTEHEAKAAALAYVKTHMGGQLELK